MSKKLVVFASDHAAVGLKKELEKYVQTKGYEVLDLGPADESQSCSYALQGHKLANYMNENEDKVAFGIGLCGTGLGISYALNRHTNIRAARVTSVADAHMAKQHNDANVLVFGGRITAPADAKAMVDEYLNTEFEGGRHQQRIKDIDNFEKY
ncbi:RpiB/LacA/LacB family sugar-phosphate isomerase [Mycoplasmopsis columbinasalis]|uniref:Ribose-5-phosphate isomerase B n=1 Tax=Mycoplasmopsis columbinasalis TaxID=114880 RepID=A0A449BAM0_9BACT|nr:RpiB/LacA/LacB family sugar-phosphate isomerase [Mycoplasmopsis columbinasalis]VEU78077.1 ribose-5-phosphate isomerase B [Mycoplasmopsis columbinasalis]